MAPVTDTETEARLRRRIAADAGPSTSRRSPFDSRPPTDGGEGSYRTPGRLELAPM